MKFENLYSLLRRRPFRPFRITVTTREEFEISHPDLAIVTLDFIAIGLPRDAHRKRRIEVDDFVWVDFSHIVHIQPLERDSIPF